MKFIIKMMKLEKKFKQTGKIYMGFYQKMKENT